MPAEPYTAVDVEGAVRAWAREAITGVSGRAYFAPNTRDGALWPQLVLFRIRGPDEACMIQFDIHTDSVHGKAIAETVRRELVDKIALVNRYRHENTILHGASVWDERWLPDLESGAARYVVEAYFTATAAR